MNRSMDHGISRLVSVAAQAALITVFTCTFGVKTADAQSTKPADHGRNASSADHKFASEAASGGMAEVKLGELAQQKAASEKVKEFGQRMVTDHSKAGEELKQVAQQENLNLPQRLSREDQATYDRLSKLNGKQFDEAYTRAMLTDHQKDVAALQKESSSGKENTLAPRPSSVWFFFSFETHEISSPRRTRPMRAGLSPCFPLARG